MGFFYVNGKIKLAFCYVFDLISDLLSHSEFLLKQAITISSSFRLMLDLRLFVELFPQRGNNSTFPHDSPVCCVYY